MVRFVLSCLLAAAAWPACAADRKPTPPVIASAAAPAYPQAELLPGITERVRVVATISATGTVEKAEVEKTSGLPPLDRAALEAVRATTFKPALDAEGNPIAMEVLIPVGFGGKGTALQRPCAGLNNTITEYLRFNPGKKADDLETLLLVRGLLTVQGMSKGPLTTDAGKRMQVLIDGLVAQCKAHPELTVEQALEAAVDEAKKAR